MRQDGDITGGSLAVIAIVTGLAAAVLAAFSTSVALWICMIVFCLLWLTGALALSDGASRAFLAGTLRKSTYTQIYTTLTRRTVLRLWARFCDPAEDRAGVPTLFRAALTWRLYDAALLIAVFYPFMLLFGQWIATGQDGRVGSFVLLEAAPFWWDRAITLGLLIWLIFGFVAGRLASASRHRVMRQVADMLPLVALVCSSSTAVGLATALAFAPAVAVAGALAGAFGGAVAVAVANLDQRGRPRAARWLVTLAVSGGVVAAITLRDLSTIADDRRSLFVFLAVLPLLNAIFDTLSYAVTLTLMRRGLRSRAPWLWGLLDLAVACVLFLALGITLVVVIHGLNELAGVPLVDLPALFAGVHERPGEYAWLYLMLFSTILPTVAHAGLSLLGVQGLWPLAWRRPVAGWVGEASASPLRALRASLALAMIWTLPLVALGGILWALWQVGGGAVLWLLSRYFDALLWLAAVPVGAI